MEVNISPEVRQKVVDWVNSKSKDLSTGLEILALTGYKPHVCANFIAHKTRQDIPKKLESELRLYLRYYANPSNSIHQDEELETDEEKEFKVLGNIEKELQNEEYPPIIKQLLTAYSSDYKKRSIAHKELKLVGEDNSEESCTKRKDLLFVIACSSLRQDAFWKAFEAFKSDGTLPAEELFTAEYIPAVNKETDENKAKKSELVLATDLVGLKKQSDNWRIKISKAENQLNFCSDKKEDKPNPMPEGPKRTMKEKRVAQLIAEKLQIDTAIADLK